MKLSGSSDLLQRRWRLCIGDAALIASILIRLTIEGGAGLVPRDVWDWLSLEILVSGYAGSAAKRLAIENETEARLDQANRLSMIAIRWEVAKARRASSRRRCRAVVDPPDDPADLS